MKRSYIVIFDREEDESAWVVEEERLEVLLRFDGSAVSSFDDAFVHIVQIVGVEMSHRIDILGILLLGKHVLLVWGGWLKE